MREELESPAAGQAAEAEISLKEVVQLAGAMLATCRRHWPTIGLVALPFVGWQVYQLASTPTRYPASITFIVNDSKSSTVGAALGQFSSLLGGRDANLERVLELARSRQIIERSLFDTLALGGQKALAANQLIRAERLQERWAKDTALRGFTFQRARPAEFGERDNRALLSLCGELLGTKEHPEEALFSTSLNKKSQVMTLSVRTRSEELSIALAKSFYKSLNDYYVESSTRKERDAYEALLHKKDSIEAILYRNDVASAQHTDRNNNLLLNVDKVPEKRFVRNNQMMTALLGEVLKNLEVAEFALKTATPYVTSIDEPIAPIEPERPHWLRSLALALAGGLALGAAFVIGREKLREMLR